MERIWHNYKLLEEHKFGLWRNVYSKEKSELIKRAYKLMNDVDLWGDYMNRLITEWKYSCEQNLSHNQHNRIAWIGQGAVCLATRCPESIVRIVWWQLTENQKDNANKNAEEVLQIWIKKNCHVVEYIRMRTDRYDKYG